MPFFDFACEQCGHQFEKLSRPDATPPCPSCSSERVKKLLSRFAIGAAGAKSSGAPMPMGACGSCGDPRGPGACRSN